MEHAEAFKQVDHADQLLLTTQSTGEGAAEAEIEREVDTVVTSDDTPGGVVVERY